VLWLAVAFGIATDTPLLVWPALVVCWPIAWLFILPVFGRVNPADETEVIACAMIGVNSFLWGYGISWQVSLLQRPTSVVPPR
jgi:hypothetical protein